MKKQAGFTMIELVMVIVILGILAAVALPKFVDLGADAKLSAVKGVAAALSSAGTINYAQRSIHAGSGVATSGVACQTIASGVMEGGAPTGYTFGGTGPNCTVYDNTASAVIVPAPVPAIL